MCSTLVVSDFFTSTRRTDFWERSSSLAAVVAHIAVSLCYFSLLCCFVILLFMVVDYGCCLIIVIQMHLVIFAGILGILDIIILVVLLLVVMSLTTEYSRSDSKTAPEAEK
jgi:hypothetical protein